MILTLDQYRSGLLAQADSGGYDPGGYVVWEFEGTYYLSDFSHCSCYDTFTSLCGGGIGDYYEKGTPSFMWSGTKEELIAMAIKESDPAIPERKSDPEDYQYKYLMDVFKQIREHFKCQQDPVSTNAT